MDMPMAEDGPTDPLIEIDADTLHDEPDDAPFHDTSNFRGSQSRHR